MMSNKPVISARQLSKTFRVVRKGLPLWKKLFASAEEKYHNIHALAEVSFQILKGEMVGVIGKNGSGKSTLLKIILGALDPDDIKSINIDGKVIRLALDMVLDDQISTRDNIYLNGAMLGIEKNILDQEFEHIISFAELSSYEDTQVKYYSTGMKTRLAFAIAMLVEADVYLIDEFFAEVGDESFRNKALSAFEEKTKDGKTVIHVTHNMSLIQGKCDKIIFLKNGNAKVLKDNDEAIKLYRSE